MANKSQPVLPGDNLSQFEEDLKIDKEFEYCTSEDSIYKSHEQNAEIEPTFPRLGNGTSISKEIKSNVKAIKSVLKKFNDSSKTYEFLVKFEVQLNTQE